MTRLYPWMVVFGSLVSGCSGEVVMAGNLAVAAVPCVLVVLTMNLKRIR